MFENKKEKGKSHVDIGHTMINVFLHLYISNKYPTLFSDTASDWCYAMFLPPHHHILLKCRSQSSTNLVVSIATDTWTVLPHVDRFLDGIMN